MTGTPIGFAQLVAVTSIPVRGSGKDAIPDSQRLDLPAGFNSVDLHVITMGSHNYGVLRYFPQDDAWRLERGLSLFDTTVPNQALDPLSIPSDRAMSLAIYCDAISPDDVTILSATVR